MLFGVAVIRLSLRGLHCAPLDFLVAALVLWPVFASASDPCALPATPGMRILCGDQAWRLAVRPAELDGIAASLVSAVTPLQRRSLEREQALWFRQTIGPCTSLTCVSAAVSARADILEDRLMSMQAGRRNALPDRDARSTCYALARLANEGKLGSLAILGRNQMTADTNSAPRSSWLATSRETQDLSEKTDEAGSGPLTTIYRLKLRAGEPPTRFGAFSTGGTCHSTEIFNIDAALHGDPRGGRREVVDPGQLVRWAYWGGGDYPIFYKGRHFLIAADLSDPNDINMVSAIHPNGDIVPICLMHAATKRLEQVTAASASVCTEITKGTAKPLLWQEVAEDTLEGLEGVAPGVLKELFDQTKHDGGGQVLKVDVQNTGNPILLGRTIYDSGAGCGSHSEWLTVVPATLAGLNKHPLDGFLGKLTGKDNDFYVRAGTTYLRVSNGGASDELLSLHGARVETECRWNRRKEVERMLLPPTADVFAIALALGDIGYPCNYEGSQQEVNACAFRDFSAADKLMSREFRVVMSEAPSSRRSALRTEQRRWLTRRNSTCESKAKVSEDDSVWPVEYFGCLQGVTEKRTKELGLRGHIAAAPPSMSNARL